MKKFRSRIKYDIVWISIDGKTSVFRPFICSSTGDWKIPIYGKNGIFEVFAGKNDKRIIFSEQFFELPVSIKGRLIVLADPYGFLKTTIQKNINEIMNENRRLTDEIKDMKEKLLESKTENLDIKIFSDLTGKKEKSSRQQDKDIAFNPQTRFGKERPTF
jgi:regulator of replication initiation timing